MRWAGLCWVEPDLSWLLCWCCTASLLNSRVWTFNANCTNSIVQPYHLFPSLASLHCQCLIVLAGIWLEHGFTPIMTPIIKPVHAKFFNAQTVFCLIAILWIPIVNSGLSCNSLALHYSKYVPFPVKAVFQMQCAQITILALPWSHTWPSDLLPPQASFHFLPDFLSFSKFMFVTPVYLSLTWQETLMNLLQSAGCLLKWMMGVSFIDGAEQKVWK